MPEDARSWRELLAQIIHNPMERDRIANEMGVRSITLNGWVNIESSPRLLNVRQLLSAVPAEFRDSLTRLLEVEYPDLEARGLEAGSLDLSMEFIRQVLHLRSSTPDQLRYWAITRRVLQHALLQLDPDRIGMSITLVSCIPPRSGGVVSSLREREGLGTPPWEGDLSHHALLLGADSLAGYVV